MGGKKKKEKTSNRKKKMQGEKESFRKSIFNNLQEKRK